MRPTGDSNEDGVFNQLDLVSVLQAGKYLDDAPATFAEGDWNGDGFFDQRDLVLALQAGTYAGSPLAALSSRADAVFAELARDAKSSRVSPTLDVLARGGDEVLLSKPGAPDGTSPVDDAFLDDDELSLRLL